MSSAKQLSWKGKIRLLSPDDKKKIKINLESNIVVALTINFHFFFLHKTLNSNYKMLESSSSLSQVTSSRRLTWKSKMSSVWSACNYSVVHSPKKHLQSCFIAQGVVNKTSLATMKLIKIIKLCSMKAPANKSELSMTAHILETRFQFLWNNLDLLY